MHFISLPALAGIHVISVSLFHHKKPLNNQAKQDLKDHEFISISIKARMNRKLTHCSISLFCGLTIHLNKLGLVIFLLLINKSSSGTPIKRKIRSFLKLQCTFLPLGDMKCLTLGHVFSFADPPSVTLSVQPQTVTEGAKVLFICSASANPEITGYRYLFKTKEKNKSICGSKASAERSRSLSSSCFSLIGSL